MESKFSSLLLKSDVNLTPENNRCRIENMFPITPLLGSNGKHDLLILASLLRRLPYNVAVNQCSTAASPKEIPQQNTKAMTIPSLPVQPLEQMLQTYLKSIKPFVNVTQLKRTTELIKEFCSDENTGKKLQELLLERARSKDNWLSEWWLNTAYLEYRNPVVVYSSPGLVWPKEYIKDLNHQLSQAAYSIEYALDFYKIIEEKRMKPEILGGKHALCMSQYEKIFGTCRIPKMPKDELRFQDPNDPSDNIIIMYNNHVFSIPAFKGNSREPMTATDYYQLLLSVVEQGTGDLGPGVGVLTTEHRDNWARSYDKLKQDPKNKEILENYVEKALFVVCIDNPLCLGSGLNYDTRCSRLLLHGFGYRGNAGNRWYDKTIQIIIGAHGDGRGIAYEHSPAEGGPIGILTDHILSNLNKNANAMDLSHTKGTAQSKAKKLEFQLTDSLKEDIEAAGRAVDKLNDELDVFSWSFVDYGKDELKKLNVSPDSFIQIAIQLAFYSTHNYPGAQYESGTLRKFLYGRTDVIRTCSEAVVDFCRVMLNPIEKKSTKYDALMIALRDHKAYAQNVVNGCGVDRHILALKLLAKMNKMESPEVFEDVAYKKSTYFQLSTSNVPTKFNGFMVYGPLVQDGYACCYNPRGNNINFGMSAWSTCRATRLTEFQRNLKEALTEMRSLLRMKSTPSKL